LGHQRRDFDISIYATDISRQALGEAQAGIYSLEDVEHLPDNILESYFARSEDYKVKSDIKRMVSFSCLDLTSPIRQPILDLDCIFCCNVLIYLQKQLQKKVLGMLYDSLATPSYLVLGEMEAPIGNLGGKLECLDSKAKIYKKVRTN